MSKRDRNKGSKTVTLFKVIRVLPKVGLSLYFIVCVLLMGWFIISFIDVNLHNFSLDEASKMWEYNLFILIS